MQRGVYRKTERICGHLSYLPHRDTWLKDTAGTSCFKFHTLSIIVRWHFKVNHPKYELVLSEAKRIPMSWLLTSAFVSHIFCFFSLCSCSDFCPCHWVLDAFWNLPLSQLPVTLSKASYWNFISIKFVYKN
jgi:hypothetical protein